MFTTQHYDKIAKLINDLAIDVQAKNLIAVTFAGFFLGDNPRFDLPKFLLACHKRETGTSTQK